MRVVSNSLAADARRSKNRGWVRREKFTLPREKEIPRCTRDDAGKCARDAADCGPFELAVQCRKRNGPSRRKLGHGFHKGYMHRFLWSRLWGGLVGAGRLAHARGSDGVAGTHSLTVAPHWRPRNYALPHGRASLTARTMLVLRGAFQLGDMTRVLDSRSAGRYRSSTTSRTYGSSAICSVTSGG
jgi:hypothetical protein